MKTIKSVLIGALVALFGSSALAEVSFNPASVTVEVGAQQTVTLSGASGTSSTWTIQTQPNGSTANASISGTTLTITGVGAGDTSCTVRHSYRSGGSNRTEEGTISITVTEPTPPEPDIPDVVMDEIRLSHGESAVLTNETGDVIHESAVEKCKSTDERIAKVVYDAAGNASVTNIACDGTAEIVVETKTCFYVYNVRCMTVEIQKTVKSPSDLFPDSKSNATIRVTSHVLTGVNAAPTNRILFVSSACANHELEGSVVEKALLSLAKKGNVDWFIFDYKNSTEASQTAVKSGHSGKVTMGATTVTGLPGTTGSGHRNMAAYLKLLDDKLAKVTRQRTYDYIVLEFDGNRLASDLTVTDQHKTWAASVAKKLQWYYNNKRVIWIVDPAPGKSQSYASQGENGHDPYYMKDTSTKQYYYTPSSFYFSGSDKNLGPDNWELLVALLDPNTYLAKASGSRYVEIVNGDGEKVQTKSDSTYWGATRNDLQATYEKPENVTDILEKNVNEAEYEAQLVDTVQEINNSLSIVGDPGEEEVHFYTWKGKSAPVAPAGGTIADLEKGPSGWVAEPESAFKVDGYQVTANISNITQETWNMFEIEIVDDGTFLQSCIAEDKKHEDDPDWKKMAVYDEDAKAWKVDPNNGEANVTLYMKDGSGGAAEAGSSSAATMSPWEMELIPLKIYVDDAEVTYGDDVPTTLGFKDGAARYDRDDVDVTKITGLDDVTFGTTYTKGSPVGSNYSINTNSAALSSTYYAITVVPGTLTVKPAPIKPVKPGENPPEDGSPYTAAPCIERTYDGNGTNITADVFNIKKDVDTPTFLYSLTENGPFKPWNEISIVNVTNENGIVMSNKVWYTVTTKTADDDENYFAATNFAYVKINPRPVTVIAADSYKSYDGTPLTDSNFTTYPSPATPDAGFVNNEGIKSVTMTKDSTITNVGTNNNVIATITPKPGTLLENYSVTTNAGELVVWQSDMTADDADAWKTYDGIATNITVTPSVSGCDIYYAPDPNNKKDETRVQPVKLFAAARRITEDEVPSYITWPATPNPNVTYTDACVSNKVWYKVVDPTGNHSNVYGYAYVTIEPREVQFLFPKAEKPYDGNGNYADLTTNLVGLAVDNMVGSEQFTCTGTGSFTNVNVGASGEYFVLDSVKLDAGVNTFFRNYTIKYWADGDYNAFSVSEDDGAAKSVTLDTKSLPNGTDGEITVIPMTIGGVKQPGTAGEQIPVEPTDDTTWTNGAVSVEKVYDAKATNIVVTVNDPKSGTTVYYCYDDGTGKPAGDWKTYANFEGYTDVTNTAPVWYYVESFPNYLPVTNRAFVTITPAQILGKKTANKPWATATSVEIWIDDLPQGGSTNIIVESDLLGSDQPTYRYSVKDPAKGAEWVDAASFEGFKLPTLATNVWCEVSGGSNYLPTNVVAHVAIWQREAEIEGKDSVGNAKEIQEALETNANKYKTSEHEYVKLRVTITPADEVPADDFVGRKIRTTKTEADKQVDAIVAAASAKAKVAESEIVADLYDLVLERTYDKTAGDALVHGAYLMDEWDDIGANGENKDLYKFELSYNKPSGYDLIGVYKYHNGAKKLREGSNQADCYKITTKGGKQVLTVWLKEFCLAGPVFMPHPAPKPTSGCQPQPDLVKETAWIYEWKFTGKTTNGVKIEGQTVSWGSNCQPGGSKTYGDEAIRVPSTLKIQGYTAKCIPACEDISTADFAGDGEVFWLTKPFKAAFDEDSGLSGLAGHVIAKSGNKYELAGRFSGADDDAGEFYDFVFAGIGSYSKSKLRVSSVSGNFAGTMMLPHYHKYDKSLGSCPEAQIWNCDKSGYAGAPETVAYGKWSMKYQSTASKKYLKDGTRPKAKNGAKWH